MRLRHWEVKYDRVVTINNMHWPAYRKPGATLVDLRVVDRNECSSEPRLVFRPEKLRELGIADELIEAAAKYDPQGLLLFDDSADQMQPANTLLHHKPSSRNSSHYIIQKHLVPFFGEFALSDIDKRKCQEWITMLTEK